MNERARIVDSSARHQIALLADVRFYREGLTRALEGCPQLEIVGAAPVNADGLALLKVTRPEIVLLEVAPARMDAVVQAVLAVIPRGKVVAIAIGDEELNAVACAEAGAAGYVSNEASVEELIAIIMRVACGEFPCSPHVASFLALRLSALSARGTLAELRQALTAREWEIVRLLDDGLTNKEIAKHLGIVVSTVKNHVHNILNKTRVSRRAQAAARLRPWNGSQQRNPR